MSTSTDIFREEKHFQQIGITIAKVRKSICSNYYCFNRFFWLFLFCLNFFTCVHLMGLRNLAKRCHVLRPKGSVGRVNSLNNWEGLKKTHTHKSPRKPREREQTCEPQWRTGVGAKMAQLHLYGVLPQNVHLSAGKSSENRLLFKIWKYSGFLSPMSTRLRGSARGHCARSAGVNRRPARSFPSKHPRPERHPRTPRRRRDPAPPPGAAPPGAAAAQPLPEDCPGGACRSSKKWPFLPLSSRLSGTEWAQRGVLVPGARCHGNR